MESSQWEEWSTFLGLNHIVSGVSQYIRPVVWLLQLAVRSPNDPSRQEDLILFLILYGSSLFFNFVDVSDERILRAGIVLAAIVVSIFLVLTLLALGRAKYNVKVKSWNKSIDCTKPLILPCRTNHSRTFPKKHSFGYQYLQVSIPVEYEGKHGLVSVGESAPWSLFSINPKDHLQRSCNLPALKDRLNAYLRSEGVDSRVVHHSYLVTAPRFLGYSFNPVSFWYLFDKADHLVMMILEVNNTFDERRMYLVKPDESSNIQSENGQTRIKDQWKKDFHVSPFNSRKGEYSLSSLNSFRGGKLHPPGIDNTIVLRSSKDHVKLVARLVSEAAPLNPNNLKAFDLVNFLSQWCWLGLFTFPRIVKEAFLLFFWRKLHVWHRPEVVPTSIGRSPTSTEVALEPYFKKYLNNLVQRSPTLVVMTYESGLSSPVTVTNAKTINKATSLVSLKIKVTSPAFYTNFVRYSTSKEAFEKEAFGEEKTRTMFVSEPQVLFSLLESQSTTRIPKSGLSSIDRVRWRVISLLRPTRTDQPSKTRRNPSAVDDSRLSDFDRFVISLSDSSSAYRRNTSRLLFASSIAFGHEKIIDGLDLLFRGLLIYFAIVRQSADVSPILVHAWGFVKG